ncbi:hypothetical protein JG688_00014102 [Phytophthora aleatoria]|uniref:Uncharacterized protein n=1 Tax=Phytophthora aleatoria TaxID=2496075 RepID=A0A8J5IKX5_9STRA|nr:hypothetical protein JG688_00014102 [Phytophthora aleatoria]
MSSFMRDEYHEWLEWYVEGKKATDTAYESLLRRFTYRHGFVQRTPSGLTEKLSDLITVRDDFAKTFKETHSGFDAYAVFNTDETGIC